MEVKINTAKAVEEAKKLMRFSAAWVGLQSLVTLAGAGLDSRNC